MNLPASPAIADDIDQGDGSTMYTFRRHGFDRSSGPSAAYLTRFFLFNFVL
jgi:hypothetical protein